MKKRLYSCMEPNLIDAIRQTKATLAIEQMYLSDEGEAEIIKFVKGEITRKEFQAKLKEIMIYE